MTFAEAGEIDRTATIGSIVRWHDFIHQGEENSRDGFELRVGHAARDVLVNWFSEWSKTPR